MIRARFVADLYFPAGKLMPEGPPGRRRSAKTAKTEDSRDDKRRGIQRARSDKDGAR